MDKLACQTRGHGVNHGFRTKTARGITLVEVLLSLLLLTVGVVALMSVFATSLKLTAQARRLTLTAAHAQRRLDSVAALPCNRLNATPRPSGTSQPPLLDGFRDSWTVTGSSDAPVITVFVAMPDAEPAVEVATVVPCR